MSAPVLKPIEPDYTERSLRCHQQVEQRLVLSGWEKFQRGAEAAKEGERSFIAAVKFIRLAGLDWKAARDGQLTFNAYTQNWYDGVKTCLPADCHLQKMVYAVRVAELLADVPKTLEDCKPVLQLVLFATEVFPAQKRLEDQTAQVRNPYNEVVTHAQRLCVQFQRYKQSKPLAQWTADMLKDFVKTTRPLVDDALEAQRLLERNANALEV